MYFFIYFLFVRDWPIFFFFSLIHTTFFREDSQWMLSWLLWPFLSFGSFQRSSPVPPQGPCPCHHHPNTVPGPSYHLCLAPMSHVLADPLWARLLRPHPSRSHWLLISFIALIVIWTVNVTFASHFPCLLPILGCQLQSCDFSCSTLYTKYPEQSVAHSRTTIFIDWNKHLMRNLQLAPDYVVNKGLN